MCDIVNGQIIVAGPTGGRADKDFLSLIVGHVPLPHLGNLYSVLEEAGVPPGPAAESIRADLLACEPGTESQMIRRLYHLWAEHAHHHWRDGDDPYYDRTVWIGPNHVLTGSADTTPWDLLPAKESPLGDLAKHRSPTGDAPRIAVLDSGISDPAGVALPTVVGKHGFVGDRRTVVDGHGHGTVVASCIAAVDPTITLDILKVISDTNSANEFDVLAALASRPVACADVVNLSLAFGLQDANCGQCGDRHHSSMSDTFQAMVQVVAERGAIVVAAAGNNNGKQPEAQPLSYPARFTSVVAVGALDNADQVLATSNLGVAPTYDHDQPVLVFAPGTAVLDRMHNGTAKPITGTSMACAYVSAMLAVIKRVGGHDKLETINALIGAATHLTDPSMTRHGHGRVNWPDLLTEPEL
jgi:subtilisin